MRLSATAFRSRTRLGVRDAEQEISADWLTRYWMLAEATSEVDARKFLAHLLATEIKRSESLGAQTMSVLPILTP